MIPAALAHTAKTLYHNVLANKYDFMLQVKKYACIFGSSNVFT